MNTLEENQNKTVPTYHSPWLFHQQAFRKFSGEADWRNYYQYSDAGVLAALHCSLHDDQADTKGAGLFGCLDLFEGADAGRFLSYVTEDLDSRGIKELSVTVFPELYDEDAAILQRQAFHSAQFLLENGGRNALIDVVGESEWKALEDVPEDMGLAQEPLDQLHRIHQIFEQQEDRRVRTDHLDFSRIERLVQAFPEQSYLFVVRNGAVPCAFGIVLDIGGGVLHTAYLEQLNDHFAFDPLLGLLQHLYEWAKMRDYKWIDLGESSLDLGDKVDCRHVSRERWVKRW